MTAPRFPIWRLMMVVVFVAAVIAAIRSLYAPSGPVEFLWVSTGFLMYSLIKQLIQPSSRRQGLSLFWIGFVIATWSYYAPTFWFWNQEYAPTPGEAKDFPPKLPTTYLLDLLHDLVSTNRALENPVAIKHYHGEMQ